MGHDPYYGRQQFGPPTRLGPNHVSPSHLGLNHIPPTHLGLNHISTTHLGRLQYMLKTASRMDLYLGTIVFASENFEHHLSSLCVGMYSMNSSGRWRSTHLACVGNYRYVQHEQLWPLAKHSSSLCW